MSKKVRQNYNSALIELISAKPIAFNPALARIAKSAGAGLLLSQLLYWWGKGNKRDWIYKTIAEIQEETSLTRSEQDRAIKIWSGLGIVRVERKGIPAKRYFSIDILKLEHLLQQYARKSLPDSTNKFAENSKLECSNSQSITESIQENTSRDHVLHTLRRPQNLDINAASNDLANKFSINKNPKP